MPVINRNGIFVRVSAGELALGKLISRRLQYRTDRTFTIARTGPNSFKYCVPDFVFFRGKVAAWYDGCYWHECPAHHPSARKGAATELDRRNDQFLESKGWLSLRVWEHDDLKASADLIVQTVRSRRAHAA